MVGKVFNIFNRLCLTPALSKGEGAIVDSFFKVLSFGEDLDEAKTTNPSLLQARGCRL
jgi:hypothetical protein